MKKSCKITWLIIAALVVLAAAWMIFTGEGKFFWRQAVLVPVMKNFAVPCGYGGTTGNFVGCECDGWKFADVSVGSTTTYCTGQCGQCACSKTDFATFKTTPVNCKEFKDMSWSFPLE